MFGLALAAACIPAHDEALNDRSLIPPVSVTMQPRTLDPVPPAAAELLGAPAEVLLLLLDDEAELVLLPHAAMASIADTASAAVAHALCLPARLRGAPRRSSVGLAACGGSVVLAACGGGPSSLLSPGSAAPLRLAYALFHAYLHWARH
jgi:hypothetical protein